LAESGEKRIRDGARKMVQRHMEKKKKKKEKKKKNHRWGFFLKGRKKVWAAG